MVGSKQYFLYETDALQTFVIQIDESNAEAMGAVNPSVGSTVLYGIPRNLKPRYARYVTASGLRSRLIPICSSIATSDDLPAQFTVGAPDTGGVSPAPENVFNIKTLSGEIFKVQVAIPDTGLTDGD